MDVPISVGVVLALGLSLYETANHATHAYFDSAIMLLFFLLCGRYLDLAVRRKTRLLAGNLASLKAEFAHRFEQNGELARVPAAASGRRRPRAGAAGRTHASGWNRDRRRLGDRREPYTGETTYRNARAGAIAYAGSVNISGALTLRVSAAGSGTLVDEVDRLIAKALQAKSHILRLADRAAQLYAPVVHVTAALAAIGWIIAGASIHDAIVIAIAVLIITCPCAIALAIPAVQVVASGALFRNRVILNGGDAIERLAAVDTIVFDKTGTLTLPDPQVDTNAGDQFRFARACGKIGAVESSSLGGRPRQNRAATNSLRRRSGRAGPRRSRDRRRPRGAAGQRGILRDVR